ncbi:MAG: hypothetical protein ACYC1U_06895 [Candidatus Aquicultorales bacterium]
MKILYDLREYAPGKRLILHAIPEKDLFYFSHTTNVPLGELAIDEIEANQFVCQSVLAFQGKVDEHSEPRYFVDGNGDLCVNEGWEEYVEAI